MHILCPFLFFLRKSLERPRPGGADEGHGGATPLEEDTARSGPSCLPSPVLSPERREDELHICSTECWRAVWPPNYARNTEPLALEVSGATRGGAATQLPGCTMRGGWGGGGEGGDSAERNSALGLTVSANLSGEDRITTELKRSKLAPPPAPPALLPGPRSVCSCPSAADTRRPSHDKEIPASFSRACKERTDALRTSPRGSIPFVLSPPPPVCQQL